MAPGGFYNVMTGISLFAVDVSVNVSIKQHGAVLVCTAVICSVPGGRGLGCRADVCRKSMFRYGSKWG